MSELYTLPDGWEWKKLRELCKFENGDRGKNYPSKSAFVESGIAVISATNLNGWDIDLDGLNYITAERYNLLGGGKVKNGDILFCLRGSLGKCGLVKNFDKGVIASSLVIVRPTNILSTDLLLYYFNSNIVNELINQYNNGSAQPNLSAKNLSLFEFPLPPLEEQKRIVAKLDNLFAKIDKAIALHQKNIDEANVFMASVLNDVFVELEEKYEIKTVYDLCTKITDGTHSTPKYIDSGVPFLSVKNISQGLINFDDTRFISIEEHNLLSKRCNVEKNDILYTKVGTTGLAKVVDTDIEFSIFVSIALLKPKKDLISSMYFQHILNSPNCYDQSQSRTRGVANRNLVLNDIKQIFFPLPPLKTQQKVVSYLDEISQKMEKIKQIQKEKMQSLKALKASILDQAFKGEL